MHKPGSHRGSTKVKKKKFLSGEKKKPVQLIDKVRNYILEVKKQLEEDIKRGKNVRKTLNCKQLADLFKCKQGDIVVCIQQLNREGLVSSIYKRYMSFYILGIEEPKKEKKNIKALFNFDNCPLCEKELVKTEHFHHIYDENSNKHYSQWDIKEKILISYTIKCENGCFYYDIYEKSYYHEIKVFDKRFSIPVDSHKSIINDMVAAVKKEINKLKKDEKYLVKLLTKDF